jgi:adenosine deaminase
LSLGLRRKPKIELHLHLEGCLTPAEALVLARKHGLDWDRPRVLSHYRHADFGDFLRHFGALLDLFRAPEDLCWLLDRVRRRLAFQGVVYAEVRVSPSVWERHGLAAEATLSGLLKEGAKGPVELRFIVDGVRQWARELLERDLDLACRFRREGVVAFGLGGDEGAAPAASLRTLADECRSRQMPVVPHAGEALGSEEVASALEVFAPRRIGHGIAAARSSRVLGELRRREVHLEVCPTSNRRTGVVAPGQRHPTATLWRSGVPLSLGTDDPALFGATLCGELRWAARSAGWGLGDMARSQKMAAQAAFLPRGQRDALVRRIESGW